MTFFKWKNGQVRVAVFVAVLFSTAFSYFLFFDKGKPANSKDLRPILENQLLALENDQLVFRAWKQSNPKINIDTLRIFNLFEQRQRKIDSLLAELEE